MLDFVSLQKQINAMVFEQKSARRNYSEKIALAKETLEYWSELWKTLVEKLEKSRTSWLLAADIQEPLHTRHPLPTCPGKMTVIATDGSQIFPDRHELAACYLINIGAVVLHYGTGERPVLANRPILFHRENETYRKWDGKRIQLSGEFISAQRGALEIQELTRLAEHAANQQRHVIGLTDGTLILWNLEGKPRNFRQEILHGYLTGLEALKASRIPIMGYISQPESADLINVLRVGICPEYPPNCDNCPYKGKQPELPCEAIEGITDAALFAEMLQDGERSPVFQSSSAILEEYGIHTVYFFYLHVGVEVARIEIPKWIAQDAGLLAFVHAAAYDQAQKGQGYPVSLAEAHEQAIIRGNEREQFYRLLEQLYVRQGLQVNLSRKFIKKRNVSI